MELKNQAVPLPIRPPEFHDHCFCQISLVISISGLEPSSVENAGGETTHTVYGGPDNDNRLFLETDIGGELFGEGGNDYLSSQFGGTLDGGEGDDIIETLGEPTPLLLSAATAQTTSYAQPRMRRQ
jgi:hypothetical protein